MTTYEFEQLANIRHSEALNSATHLAQGRAARRSEGSVAGPADPLTFRWFLGSFRRWRENRSPRFVRHGGYGELYSGSFRS